jgi:hypothetical protein
VAPFFFFGMAFPNSIPNTHNVGMEIQGAWTQTILVSRGCGEHPPPPERKPGPARKEGRFATAFPVHKEGVKEIQ